MAKKIFVVSSREAMAHAKSFMKSCKDEHIEYYPWWEHFRPGHTTIEELERFKRKLDGAVIILTPEIRAKIRKSTKSIPNLNVLFEYGFFLSKFNRKRVAVVKYGNVYLPSDLDGLIAIPGSAEYTTKPSRVTNHTKEVFLRWVEGFKQSKATGVAKASKPATKSPKKGRTSTKHEGSRFEMEVASFDAVDLDIKEPIDPSTRLRYRLNQIAPGQTYAFYFHFRTSEGEMGWVGVTNRAGAEYKTSGERSSMESPEFRPRMDVDLVSLVQRRWPEHKGSPVAVDRLRIRGDKDGKPGIIKASVWVYPKR